MRKPDTSKPIKTVDQPSDSSGRPAAPAKRVFGSARGQITFKKGWDAPMTERELDRFLRGRY